jgi:hypothetical protein
MRHRELPCTGELVKLTPVLTPKFCTILVQVYACPEAFGRIENDDTNGV